MARLRVTAILTVAAWCIPFSLILYLVYLRSQHAGRIYVDSSFDTADVSYYGQLIAEKEKEIINLTDLLHRAEQNQFVNESFRNVSISSGTEDFTYNTSGFLSLFTLLPHLNGKRELLRPRLTIGNRRPPASLVLGIPHVRRFRESYLMKTLQSLIANMKPVDMQETIIVVQVSEPWNATYCQDVTMQVQEQFSEHLRSGLIEVIVPPEQFYPNLDAMAKKWESTQQEARWRIKQNIDYIFLMTYCAERGIYYMQLADDVVAEPDYVTKLRSYARAQNGWLVLEFSLLGSAGKLYHSENLKTMVQFVALFHERKSVNLLLLSYFQVRECFANALLGESTSLERDCPEMARRIIRYRPPLFHHIGNESSLDGKIRMLQGSESWLQNQEPEVIGHNNPPAMVSTSLKQYQEFSLGKCYNGTSVFWALNPQPDDFIAFTFPAPITVSRFRLVAGDERHPSDKAFGATVEVLRENASDKYLVVDNFDKTAVFGDASLSLAEGKLPKEIGKISALRISFHVASQSWFLLKEVHIELQT